MAERYAKLDKIGEGSFGVVYKAKCRESGDLVALKRIRLDGEEEGVPCSAVREISLLKELKHDNIVMLIDVVHSEKKLTLVFEYLDQDLKKFMDVNQGNLEPPLIRSLMMQLLKSVEFCHSRSVLHRDLKPQNLLISKERVLKLADFGLGRAFGIPVKKYTHAVVTLWYRAPDALLGSTYYGTGVDMWSAGCIFGEMATGQPLHAGKSESQQLLLMFRFWGTPSRDERGSGTGCPVWPSMHSYASSASVLSQEEFLTNYPPACERRFEMPQWQKLRKSGQELLRLMLRFEPTERLRAAEAVKHNYFHQSEASGL